MERSTHLEAPNPPNRGRPTRASPYSHPLPRTRERPMTSAHRGVPMRSPHTSPPALAAPGARSSGRRSFPRCLAPPRSRKPYAPARPTTPLPPPGPRPQRPGRRAPLPLASAMPVNSSGDPPLSRLQASPCRHCCAAQQWAEHACAPSPSRARAPSYRRTTGRTTNRATGELVAAARCRRCPGPDRPAPCDNGTHVQALRSVLFDLP